MIVEEWEHFKCKGVLWRWSRPGSNIHIDRVGTINFICYRPEDQVVVHLREPRRRRPYPRVGVSTEPSKWYRPSTWGDATPQEAVSWGMELIVEHEKNPVDPSNFIPEECL